MCKHIRNAMALGGGQELISSTGKRAEHLRDVACYGISIASAITSPREGKEICFQGIRSSPHPIP